MGAAKEIFGGRVDIPGGGHMDLGIGKRDPAADESAASRIGPRAPVSEEKLRKLAEKNPEMAEALGLRSSDSQESQSIEQGEQSDG